MPQDNTLQDIEAYFIKAVAEETGIPLQEVNVEHSFHELGLDSINAIFVLEKIEAEYQIELSPLLFWDFPTIRSFSSHILDQLKPE